MSQISIQRPREPRKPHGLLRGALSLALAIALLCAILASRVFGLPLVFLYGLWLLISGALELTLLIQCLIDRLPGRLRHALSALASIALGVALLQNPADSRGLAMWLLSGYLAWWALCQALDARSALPAAPGKRRRRAPLPLLIAALIPLGKLRQFARRQKAGPLPAANAPEAPGPNALEVFVHAMAEGSGRVGHADICLGGTVITYGIYDFHATKLGGMISDGALMLAPRQQYIDFCLSEEHKLLTGFTLELSGEQRRLVERQIREVFSRAVEFPTDAELCALGRLPAGDYNDAASRLYRASGARMFKITRGKFRHYYALGTNCVAMVDQLIGPVGLDLRGLGGIITPGGYYELLNAMYNRGDTVSQKTVYKAL